MEKGDRVIWNAKSTAFFKRGQEYTVEDIHIDFIMVEGCSIWKIKHGFKAVQHD